MGSSSKKVDVPLGAEAPLCPQPAREIPGAGQVTPKKARGMPMREKGNKKVDALVFAA
jgi:hypothetical protein